MSRIRTTASVPIDPLEPMLGTVTGSQILQIVRGGNALGFSGTKKVPRNWIGVVAKGDFNRTFEAMYVTIVAGTLVGLMLFHEWNEFFGLPPLGLEIVIV